MSSPRSRTSVEDRHVDAGWAQILERVASARGKTLRAEADRTSSAVGMLLLTFDVGPVVMTSADDGIQIAGVGEREALPGNLAGLEEEKPWWHLLGQPLSAAWLEALRKVSGREGWGL